MGHRVAEIDGWDHGFIIYESVSMFAYPPIFRTKEQAAEFLDWHHRQYGGDLCDAPLGAVYSRYERFIEDNEGESK